MQIKKISVHRSKTIFLQNKNSETYSLSMDVDLEEQDEPHSAIASIKHMIDQKMDIWANSFQEFSSNDSTTEIQTADQLITKDSSDSSMQLHSEMQNYDKIEKESYNQDLENDSYMCPKCNEPMTQKAGKKYFLCSKHWGYPDMILKGEVREKQF